MSLEMPIQALTLDENIYKFFLGKSHVSNDSKPGRLVYHLPTGIFSFKVNLLYTETSDRRTEARLGSVCSVGSAKSQQHVETRRWSTEDLPTTQFPRPELVRVSAFK